MSAFSKERKPLPCIVLAAGGSSRMGMHKLLLPLPLRESQTTPLPMIRFSIQSALTSCHPVIVVTGFEHTAVENALEGIDGVVLVFNPNWSGGRVGSLLAGMAILPKDCPGFILHHADMPFVSGKVFEQLADIAIKRSQAGDPPIALVASRGRNPGHPVYFPKEYFSAIRAIGDGERLKQVLDDLGALLIETGEDGILEDIDTPLAYSTLLNKYKSTQSGHD